MLLQPKQINLQLLAYELALIIDNDVNLKQLWSAILNSTYLTAVFSVANANLANGQTNLIVNYAHAPVDVQVYRNGAKQVEGDDYTVTPGVGIFTVLISSPAGSSSGGIFSETFEINYY